MRGSVAGDDAVSEVEGSAAGGRVAASVPVDKVLAGGEVAELVPVTVELAGGAITLEFAELETIARFSTVAVTAVTAIIGLGV